MFRTQHYRGKESAPHHPATPNDYYRKIYFESIDGIILSVGARFRQESFQNYMTLENLLLNTLKKENIGEELSYIKDNYADDVDIELLLSQLDVLRIIAENRKLVAESFEEIHVFICDELDAENRKLISKNIRICKLIIVNPSTTASVEKT